MLSVPDAFAKFRGRLEITPDEQSDASRRQEKIRDQVRADLSVARDFLTGSYARDTKTKPLRDVDIFVVLGDDEGGYLQRPPDSVLARVLDILEPHYPGRVSKGNRSVKVDFAVPRTTEREVASFDVVPAFVEKGAYRIPDRRQGDWIRTDPQVHKKLASDANAAFSNEWKPLVKMIKKWNAHQGRPVKPSFLLEVMALQLLDPPWGGSYPRELRQFFASAATGISQEWEDPAKLGPAVTARLAENPDERAAGEKALADAERVCTEALRLEQAGRVGAALDAWQELFGRRFAKS